MSIFDVLIAELHEPNELAHFGVKGMKWGRRRARKKGPSTKDRMRQQSRAKISLRYDKKNNRQRLDYETGTGTLRARGVSKRLIKSKGARRQALGRAMVIQKARSRRVWNYRPFVRTQDMASGTFRERYKRARKSWKQDQRDNARAALTGGVFGEYVRQRKRQKRR